MKRLNQLFTSSYHSILNVYFTAGYPSIEATVPIINYLTAAGVDIIELGLPYSDPLADGETIQKSSSIALKNGMNLRLVFDQVSQVRKTGNHIPIILMGYFNQLLQYGVDNFLNECRKAGIDGLIIPDLPMTIYESDYKAIFEKYEIGITFLITPDTSTERIRQADRLSTSFIYVVSKSSITGNTNDIDENQISYFTKIKELKLKSPLLIGFGIYDNKTFLTAGKYSNGAIIGSAFIRQLANHGYNEASIQSFIKNIRK
jgi:tryptophan synthase alpha chain